MVVYLTPWRQYYYYLSIYLFSSLSKTIFADALIYRMGETMFFIFNFLTVLNVYLEGPLVVVLPLFPAADF